jgi:hypothetical protein
VTPRRPAVPLVGPEHRVRRQAAGAPHNFVARREKAVSHERAHAPWVAILVAILGLAGSLGVAWITTGAKFSQYLDIKSNELAQIKKELAATKEQMARQQKELDRKVSGVEDRLKKLDFQIALGQSATDKVVKMGSGLFKAKKKK